MAGAEKARGGPARLALGIGIASSSDVLGGVINQPMFMNDLKFAFRQLVKSPGFTFLAVMALGLAIGVNTAIFSVTHMMLIRAVPGIKAPERLVQLGRVYRGEGFTTMAHGDFRDLRERSASFEGLVAFQETALGLGYAGASERVRGAVVSGDYFEVLGVRLAAGRGFRPEEDQALNTHPVAVISHAFWMRRFGGEAGLVGRTVTINSRPFTVVGVAAPEFTGTTLNQDIEVWVPMAMLGVAMPNFEDPAAVLASHIIQWHEVIGRLKPGISLRQAQEEVNALAQRIQADLPEPNPDLGFALVAGTSFHPQRGSSLQTMLLLLQGVVGFVLLIACANVANMQLARGLGRAREIGIRLALGAGRWRVGRQLLVESLLLAALAGGVGVLLSAWFNQLLLLMAPAEVSRQRLDLRLDWPILGFATGVTLTAALVSGLLPAWQLSRGPVVTALKDLSAQAGSHRSRLRNSFVVAQVALSLLLLVGAGLFVRTLQIALQTHPGFAVEPVIIGSMDVGLQGYEEARGRRFYESLLERVEALPGVEAAGLAPFSPFTGATFGAPLETEEGAGEKRVQIQVNFNIVSPGFFQALRIPILQGRGLTAQDVAGAPEVVVLDEPTARRLWPEGRAVGRRVKMGTMQGQRLLEVVGVAREVRYRSLLRAPEATIYMPFAQHYQPWTTLHVRAAGPVTPLLRQIPNTVAEIDPDVPVFNLRPLSAQLSRSLWQQRFAATLMSLFGGLALALATLGIYGVMSYTVSQRRREVGVRLALGAQRGDILKLVVGQGMLPVLLGAGIGLALAAGLARILSSLLYGIGVYDPVTFGLVLLVLGAAALLACYWPARKATRVDPVVALRYE